MPGETIIRPKKTLNLETFQELWRYRELFYFFSWRDLKVRYKQTVVGVGWAIFQPFMTMVIFSVFFGRFANIPSDNIPYPIFVYVGLLIWQFFSSSLSETSNSLVANQSILTKVYFPRLILPLSAVITRFIDFFCASIVLVALMAYYRFLPNTIGLLILPLLLLLTFMISAGTGLFLAALNVKYRDIRYVLPFFIQILLFLTPVIYPASILGKHSWLLALNPMTGVIKAAHAAILGNAPINWVLLSISGVTATFLMIIGFMYFKKTERHFADLI